jgi:hypothetical protein
MYNVTLKRNKQELQFIYNKNGRCKQGICNVL